MACTSPSRRPKRVGHLLRGRLDLLGIGDVEFDDLADVAELARRALGERSAAPAPESAIVAPSSRARLAMPKASESSVKHARDQDTVIAQQCHLVSVLRASHFSRTTMATVGVLGGTGPAGRGVAARLASAGYDVVLGSRDAERAKGSRRRLHAARRGRRSSGGTNEEAADVRPRRRGDAVGLGDRDGDAPCAKSSRARS